MISWPFDQLWLCRMPRFWVQFSPLDWASQLHCSLCLISIASFTFNWGNQNSLPGSGRCDCHPLESRAHCDSVKLLDSIPLNAVLYVCPCPKHIQCYQHMICLDSWNPSNNALQKTVRYVQWTLCFDSFPFHSISFGLIECKWIIATHSISFGSIE